MEGNAASSYAAILLMALVVYATRVAGAELMTMIRITPRIEAFLKSMATSVLVAIVAAEMARGSLRESAAILGAAAVMLLTRKPMAAISAGVAIAAVYSGIAV